MKGRGDPLASKPVSDANFKPLRQQRQGVEHRLRGRDWPGPTLLAD